MDKTVSIPWGRQTRSFSLPEEALLWVATPNNIPGVPDEAAEILKAIRNPIGSPTLGELLGPPAGKKVAVVVDDNTRVTPVDKILPILLDELNALGLEDDQVTVILALGTHHAMSEADIQTKLGGCYGRVKAINHDYNNPQALVDLGFTPSGTPLMINKTYCDSDLAISISNIIPHFIAGWSGGGKIIQPGISGPATTGRVHLNGALMGSQYLGVVENPIRHEMETIARQSGLAFIINTVLNTDDEIVAVVAGDLVRAHRAGVERSKEIYQLKISGLADIVIAAAYPAIKDFWQSDKALAAAVLMVKPGGTIVLAGPCEEGVSPEHPILNQLGARPPREIYDEAERGELDDVVGAATSIKIGVMRERATVILVSDGVSKEESENIGLVYAPTLEEAISMAQKRQGESASIGILTHGGDFAPIVQP